MPFVAATFVWQGFFNDSTGWLNRMLGAIGIDGPDWINDADWILPSLGIIALWGIGNAIIIYMAALRSVPVDSTRPPASTAPVRGGCSAT